MKSKYHPPSLTLRRVSAEAKRRQTKSQITNQKSTIISNKKIKENYFEIIIEAPEIAKYAQPGQFVNIKVNDSYEPLLRRPLSVHRVSRRPQAAGRRSEKKEYIVMLYEVVGKGTEILSQKQEGEYLDVIGPLGKGFDYDGRLATDDGRRILVAGGMGSAPLVFLAEKLADSVERIAYRRNKSFKLSAIRYPLSAKVLIGAKTKKDILCEDEFRQLGCAVKIATDDGSRGFKGYVSGLLKQELSAIRYPLSVIYGCGPAAMLKEISLISRKYRVPAQISLEAHMACGIGACMGCVINTKQGFKRVCYEGPVFEAEQIIWE